MAQMTVTVRLFAILRDRAGAGTIDIDLPEPATVADALKALSQRHELADALARIPVRMAVNRELAEPACALHAGDELALIPPVSGGSGNDGGNDDGSGNDHDSGGNSSSGAGGSGGGDVHARIRREPLSLEEVSRLVARPGAGAIVTFQGTTREVQRLDYEAYVEMAEPRIRQILTECLNSHELQAVAAEHRVGAVPLGETSVIVAASAAHREEAFAGAREAIDRIKAQAPIWKRELRDGTARWVDGVLP
jgi:MoaE-MoaD fusion protein